MNTRRLRQMGFAALLSLALFAASFAAPLCACLNVDTENHDCCAGMKDHCPMKSRSGDSLDKAPPAGCSCAAEKRQTAPTKLFENGKSYSTVPALMPGGWHFVFAVSVETPPVFIINKTFTAQTFPKQTPARAPPRL